MGDKDKSQLFGEGLPGTGGDFIDDTDVEGHRSRGHLQAAGEPDGVRNPRLPGIDGADEDDTEGHLYAGGPSTQGEFAKRVPTDSPHGER